MPPKNKLSRLVKETAGFSYEFIRHPKGVGSVIPSSRMLAKAMRRTAQKFGAPDSLIIEAGAGTGAITRELVAYFPAERLLINEVNPRLARRLRDRFPGNTIRRGRVEELDVWTHSAPKTALRENAANVLIQFTYGQKSPLNLPPDSDITGARVTYAWLNFPPARIWVYRCQK